MSQPPKSIGSRFATFVRGCLFCVACLATLIALFYAEEDLRGKRAWENYKRQSSAKGTELDWRAYVPPPAPDDRNFAMTPPFEGLFDYQYTTTNALWRDTNIWARINRLALRPASVETKLGDWSHGRPVNLKEWQDWFRQAKDKWDKNEKVWNKAGRKLPDDDYWPVPSQPSQPATDVLLALSKLDPELAAIREASARPQSRFPIHYDELPKAMLVHLGFLANISRILQLRAAAELTIGSNQPAFADVTLGFYCADAIQSEPFMISQLIRSRIIERSLQSVWEGLREHRWSEDQLEKFQRYFSQKDLLARYIQTVNSDVAFDCGWIDLLPSDPASFYVDEQQLTQAPGIPIIRIMPRGWFYQNELFAARFFQRTLLPDVSPQTQRVSPSLSRTNLTLFDAVPSRNPYSFAFKAVGTGVVSPREFARTQTEINLALVACAVERFRMAHGRFPENLAALTPDLVSRLPHDMINGEPLKYRLNADGRFTLYSVGWNEKDDGGTYPSTAKATVDFRDQFKDRPETGDWVWQYPPSN